MTHLRYQNVRRTLWRWVDGFVVIAKNKRMIKVMLVIDDYSELVFLETLLKKLGFDVLSLAKDSAVSDSLLSFMPELAFATLKGRAVDGIRLAARLKKLGVAPKVALLNPAGHVVHLSTEQKSKIDALVETPINQREAIVVVSQLMKLDAQALLAKLEKLNKSRNMGEPGGMVFVRNEDTARDGASMRRPEGRAEGRTGGATDSGATTVRDEAAFDSAADHGTVGHGASGGYDKNDSAVSGGSVIARSSAASRAKRYDEIVAQMTEPVDGILPHEAMAQAIGELNEASRQEEPSLAEINRQKREFVLAMMKRKQSR